MNWNIGPQLRPKRTIVLEGCAALLGDLIHDLSADAVPEATGARSRKRLNLER